ncbi:MAG: hypothetical protein MR473_06025 [Clostridiales bacterium]|nr:hypothetical protein [Clostridiales bacterium]
MKKYFLVFLFLVTCTLPGCYRSGSVGANRRQDAAAVVNRVVPICSITNSDAVKFDECSVLERDTYGRKLCCYKTYSSLFREQVEVLLVIQKTSGDDVFYYPNDCYLLHFEGDMDFSDAEIQGLKDRNDWELPLVTEALCSVPYQGEGEAPDQIVYTIDRYSMQEYDKKIIKKYLGLDEAFIVILDGLESDREENQIVLVAVQRAEEKRTLQAYLIYYDVDAKAPVLACEEVWDIRDCREQLRDFRETYLK